MISLKCCLNGDLIHLDQCRIHISDLGLQRGYGVFDYFRAENGAIWWKEDYFERLWQSIEQSALYFPLSRTDLEQVCNILQSENNLGSSAFKVIVTGGESEDMGSYQGQVNYAVIHRPFTPPSEKNYSAGAHLITYAYQRPDPTIKNLNYYFSTRLHRQLRDHEAIDVLFCTDQVRETARSNFFGVKDGVIHTPDAEILMGITRKRLLTAEGYEFIERSIAVEELKSFDEIFITGTTREVMPVVRIDDWQVGKGTPGSITRGLMETFKTIRP